jgi:hypothetical protein
MKKTILSFRYNSDIQIEEALLYVHKWRESNRRFDKSYLRLWMADGTEWKIMDYSVKLTALLNPSGCKTAIQIEQLQFK